MSGGYIPILAHIERYMEIIGKLERAEEIKQRGIIIQVNASSVLGGSGNAAKKFVRKLLKNELVHVFVQMRIVIITEPLIWQIVCNLS